MKNNLFEEYEKAFGTNRFPIKRKIFEQMSTQCADESKPMEMDIQDLLFIAKIYGIWTEGKALISPAIRGVFVICNKGYVELFERKVFYDVRVFPSYSVNDGAIKVFTNIIFREDIKKLEGRKYETICC